MKGIDYDVKRNIKNIRVTKFCVVRFGCDFRCYPFSISRDIDCFRARGITPMWRTISGITFLFSFAMWFINILLILLDKLAGVYYKVKFRKNFMLDMNTLTAPEGVILVELFNRPTFTSQLPMNDGVVQRLTSKLMIQIMGSHHVVYGEDIRVPYTITPVALDYIQRHPEFIEKYSCKDLV